MAASPFSTDPYGPSVTNSMDYTNSIPSGTSRMGSESVTNIISGNPAMEANAASTSGNVAGSEKGQDTNDRLMFVRPRYTSNDQTNRGTHAYIALMTSDEQSKMYAGYSSPRSNSNESKQCSSSALANALAEMSTGTAGVGYDKFLLSHVQAGMDEKLQIVEVFGDNEVAYYFGRSPMIFTISGMLIDSPDNGWFTDWLEVYTGALRGSELAKNFELLKLVLPNMTLIGSITNLTWENDSVNDVTVPFRFQFLVKSLIPTPVVPIGEGITNAANSMNFSMESSFLSQTGINDLRRQGAELMATIQNPLSTLSQFGSAMSSFGSGVGASMGLKGTASGVSDFIDSLSSKAGGLVSGAKGLFSGITSGLEGIRAKIFSPIYGVMNSLTKLVKNIFGVGAGLKSIFDALTSPIKNILGDITRIANQAMALVGMITSGISGLGRSIASGFGLVQSFQSAVHSIGQAAGSIAAAPTTIGQSLKGLVHGGNLSSSAAFLQANPKHSLSRAAVLSARPGSASLSGGASLKSARPKLSPQMAILSGGKKTTPVAGAKL